MERRRGAERLRGMDEFWGVAALLLLVVVAVLAAGARYAVYRARYKDFGGGGRVLLSEAGGALKPGDILLFVAQAHNITTSVFASTLFSHSGLVVEDGGGLWVAESLADPPAETAAEYPGHGSHLIPLYPRLHGYRGMVFLMALERPLPPAQAAAVRALAREPFAYPGPWALLRGALGFPDGGTHHCYEHVAWLLDGAGVAPLRAAGYLGVARAIAGLPGAPLADGNSYREPVQVLCDVGGAP